MTHLRKTMLEELQLRNFSAHTIPLLHNRSSKPYRSTKMLLVFIAAPSFEDQRRLSSGSPLFVVPLIRSRPLLISYVTGKIRTITNFNETP